MNIFVVTTLDSTSLIDDGLLSFTEALALAVVAGGESIIRFAPGLAGNVDLGNGAIKIPDGVVIEPNSDITFLDADFTGTVTDDLGSPFVNEDRLNSPTGDGTLVLENGTLSLTDTRSSSEAPTNTALFGSLVLSNTEVQLNSADQFSHFTLTETGNITTDGGRYGSSVIRASHSGEYGHVLSLSNAPSLLLTGPQNTYGELALIVDRERPNGTQYSSQSTVLLSNADFGTAVEVVFNNVGFGVLANVGDNNFAFIGPSAGTATFTQGSLGVVVNTYDYYGAYTPTTYVALLGATSATATDSLLQVRGGGGQNTIFLARDLSLKGSFASASGGAGYDQLVAATSSLSLQNSLVYLDGYSGNDLLVGSFYGLTITGENRPGVSSRLYLFAGDGDDVLAMTVAGSISGDGFALARGESGNDTIIAANQLQLDGVTLELDGGSDDDLLALAVVTGQARRCAEDGTSCTPNIANDTIFEISDSQGNDNTVSVLGGSGDDTVVGIFKDIGPPLPDLNPPAEPVIVDPSFNAQLMDLRGFDGRLVLDGGDGDDEVTLSQVSATILGGFIELRGGAGNDTILGVDGDVRLIDSSAGADILDTISVISIYGGAGNDILQLATGEVIEAESAFNGYGGTGNDTLIGSTDLDVMYGGEGDDLLYASEMFDIIYGGEGEDTFSAALLSEPRQVIGGTEFGVAVDLSRREALLSDEDASPLDDGDIFDGVENLEGSDFADFLTGDDQANTIIGGGGGDFLSGGAGNDLLEGGAGFDALEGGAGADSLFGGEGLGDVVTYFDADGPLTFVFDGTLQSFAAGTSSIAADDVIGADVEGIFGTSGFANTFDASSLTGLTFLVGGAASDTFLGGAGTDQLLGLGGDDVIYGGAGGDGIIGGAGDDDLFGGAGVDAFFFGGAGDGNDTIHDLELGPGGDVIFIGGDVTAGDLSFADTDGGGSAAADTLITYASGATITIIDLDAATVEAGANILFG